MRKAFSLLELVFVIVVIGILANYGTNILLTSYNAYTQSSSNNRLLANTELTLKNLSNRLQYRIRDSVIVRPNPTGAFGPLVTANAGSRVLEWIGYDIDGWLGSAASTNPNWSGFIDVNNNAAFAAKTFLQSPMTNTARAHATIQALRANGSGTGFNNSAIFFTGSNSNIGADYGWDGIVIGDQTTSAHRVSRIINNITSLSAAVGNFAGVDIYENYKLAWTAYAIVLEDFNGDGRVYGPGHPLAGLLVEDLVLYYDYQPWEGEGIPPVNDVNRRQLLLQTVDTFVFSGVGDSIMLQICTNDLDAFGAADGGYSICEETTIF